MNILLSHNWLKEFIDPKLSEKELSKQLSLHSMSVERILPEVELLSEHVVLGQIKTIKPHPDADRLQIATVDDGQGEHQVVCGAPNIKEGMKILFTRPGAMVRWHGEGDPVLLEPAKIRGVESYGMITDDSEVGLSDTLNEEGVTDYSSLKAKVGTPMAKALGLDDTVFDIEITTNRIDAGSVSGMAREVAAITGEKVKQDFSHLEKLRDLKPEAEKKALSISIEDKEKCLGFSGIVLDGIKVEPSPEWLQRRLRSAGLTPLNNIVDVTNYVMHEMGHPLHAFDYAQIDRGSLVIRAAKKGEKLMTLDGKEEELDPSMVIVADKKQPLALAGIMGGESSKITDQTTTILLEGASWDAVTIRRTAMKLDKFSDASSYFTKGVSPQLSQLALLRAIELLQEITDAKIASPVLFKGYKAYKPKQVSMSIAQAEMMIGSKLKTADIKKQLAALGFDVSVDGDTVTCLVPHWRQYDVFIEEDLIEEVARLYGYQNIENKLPSGMMPIPVFDKQLEGEVKLNNLMKSAGYTEVFTYSMVSEELHAIGGRMVKEAIRLLNPLDDEHAVMRTSLIPSLLEIAAQNQSLAHALHLFEIANIYEPAKKDGLPKELPMMSGLVASGNTEKDFQFAKGTVDRIFSELGLSQEVFFEKESDYHLVNKAASIDYKLGDQWAGTIGLVDHKAAKALGLKQKTIIFILPISLLLEASIHAISYTPIPKFPPVQLDLSVIVPEKTPWGDVERTVTVHGGELLKKIELFDIYHQEDGKKSFAFHLEFRDEEKTLEMNEVEQLQKKILAGLEKELGAKLKA